MKTFKNLELFLEGNTTKFTLKIKTNRFSIKSISKSRLIMQNIFLIVYKEE